MKNILSNKRIRIISCSLIVLIIIGIIIINSLSYESKLKRELNNMAKDFYETYYYPGIVNVENKDQILENMHDVGIKISLNNLMIYNNHKNEDKLELFKNDKTNEECNKEETKVIIYPHKPYKETNYKVEVVLSCGY